MSNLVSNVIQTKLIGSPTKKAILMYMADKASDDGSGIWVSKGNMAADLEMSSRAVRIHIKDMLALNILKVTGQKECRNGYTIDYQINLEVVSKFPSTRPPLNSIHPYHGMTFSGTDEQGSPKPSNKPSTEPIILVRSIDVVVEQFNKFWEKYPRKTAKAPAQKAYAKAHMKISFEELMEKLDIFIEAHKDTNKQFLPHASTWLNQERWNDEYEKAPNFADLQKTVLREMLNAK
ncbi:possible transcription regulator [uncultured Mediterranean phage uvMED]|nr:possible transcription regulator [uncultured Mediterranean phage uvMED]BAR19743.1 putative replication protein [uncultured Mediterranean phage uvMED]BAR19822.1 putative replication protein [uncultured Mediterranean phage uvMED]